MVQIEVQYHSKETALPTEAMLQQWADVVLETHAQKMPEELEMTLRIVDEEESQSLNSQFRDKNKPTNVLSFSYSDEMMPNDSSLLGDLVLCAPIIKKEALEQHKSIEAHWAHMVIHGTLHLLGYDHETPELAAKMEPLEITLLNTLGFANPYSYHTGD